MNLLTKFICRWGRTCYLSTWEGGREGGRKGEGEGRREGEGGKGEEGGMERWRRGTDSLDHRGMLRHL